MAFNTKDIENGFESLNVDGFSFKKEIMGFSWTKKSNSNTKRIIIGYGGYPDSFKIYTPVVDIYFNEVEDLLNPILEKYNIQNRYGDTTIQKALIDIEGVEYSKLNLEINNDSTFDNVIQEVKKIILKGAISFFEKYNTLSIVAQSIENMNEDDLSNFISGIVGIKIPLIKKITHLDSFTNELRSRNEFYTNEVFKYPQYFKDHDKIFNELFSADLKISL